MNNHEYSQRLSRYGEINVEINLDADREAILG